ncbi:MAG: MarR family winged helix-turn-helix transcriptional regulator [Liquorilactobacillus nagelii]|jgi:DNA-binding MarR family transcriptional regulator|uniref:MarR family winged helix-turn-helix transcriptional regulator n=1 Tax=Liquorilactobacillus nagelii TaxID=82688 RepID=UPI0024322C5A|nr:MarR family winged helix-turn-helix transcriptional regulator [Liquorilactobacillus nagelii]MCI1633965.1 MarR family winged helix-turn-helix transcriptional regulator [Liquorilactobacillus nagelii]MCI1920945.1 MarR family winged helix-turn-helix transcriptional regulator [Liquorilactobacillus nagelii]MCI1976599.1 MarR family winged helix-turn-helix transcriptional regulator [Liquorilactobacillus nagelii]
MTIQQTIGFQVKQLANQLNRVAQQQISQAGLIEIPESQQWVLSYLYDHQTKKIFQSDLQQALGFGKSTISELLARMQKNDLIWLKQSTKDHRRKQVLLTTTSLQKAAIVNQSIRAVEKQLTNGLTNNRLTELFQLIQQLKQNLKYINSNKE